ncbi:MAG: polyphosphate kinase 1 [Flavobacteriaceae bacterium]|nr:polyphosphate kinase 1 [Flavobacteriaceae bacterium]
MDQKKTENKKFNFVNREMSWLNFNERVLEEASDKTVPLIERLRFLGIFSNNLDEFFQVRFASVKRIAQSGKSGKKVLGGIEAKDLLKSITNKVIELQQKSNTILNDIENELRKEKIFFINENQVKPCQVQYLTDYFLEKINPSLVTVILKEEFQDFTDNKTFLAIKMELNSIVNNDFSENKIYAFIELPKKLDRFIVLPIEKDGIQFIMMLDDLIRFHFHLIFSMFDYKKIDAHMFKITRDGELDIEENFGKSYAEKIMNSVRDRIFADPVRLVHDKNIDPITLEKVMTKLGVKSKESLIPGGRYHRRADYMKFPSLNRSDMMYQKTLPLPVKNLRLEENIIQAVSEKDYLIYTPYHSFSYLIKFLREAALDPTVKTIKITLYRLAKYSQVVSSLINAVKNGKKVVVYVELQARFDEENNINIADRLEKSGVHIIMGVRGLKVHSKICLVLRDEKNKLKKYGFISTGNFNEHTAKIYTDYTLFTSNQKLLKDVSKVFNFLEVNYEFKRYKHLIVSPHYTYHRLVELIDNEIQNKNIGKKSKIKLKLNSITNYKIISKLYEASNAGVKIEMIVRGVCCLIPGVKDMSENIKVISVVDKYLEHPRIYIFENAGKPKIYISSADWMTRNFENRIEVTCPIYDTDLQNQILDTFDISWRDNVKSRFINKLKGKNKRIKNTINTRSQFETYRYFKNQSHK